MILIEELNKLCKNTLIDHLGIEFTHWEENRLTARMPVNQHTRQPMGLLHGGASLALAETVGSAGSLLLVDRDKYNVVGMQISANHIGQATRGYVIAEATLLHKGSKTHVWDIMITSDEGHRISTSRLTNMIIAKG